MSDRVATLTSHGQTLRSIAAGQKSLAKVTQQISSGKKASTFNELNGVLERVIGNESKLSRIDNYVQNNKSVVTRLQVMNKSIDQVQKALEEFAGNVTLRQGATSGTQMNFQGLAKDKLDKIKAAMNVNIEGRYIFGGTKTDVKPISNIISLSESGVVDDDYYQGNSEVLSVRVSDENDITYGINADDEAIATAITAILTAMDIDADDNGQTDFSAAVNLINDAKVQLASLRANINTNITSIETTNNEHESLKIYWKEALAGDLDTDIAEASIKLSADQTVLQATYQTFALTSKLKLTDYL
jgi:flagellar hook-associated protein 3 FlgL